MNLPNTATAGALAYPAKHPAMASTQCFKKLWNAHARRSKFDIATEILMLPQ